MAATKVRLNIAGSPYVISTTDSEEYLRQLADKLDTDIRDIREKNPNASATQAAVLCALDYLDEWKKSTGNADNMRAQIKDYLADAAKAKIAADEASREVARLKNEVARLKERAAQK